MFLLALDTSGSTGSAAMLDQDNVLAETSWTVKSSHTSELPLQIEKILKASGRKLSETQAFAVTIGPGSFTGIRVGLAFVKGLALSGQKPVVGVSSLRALVLGVPEEGLLCPWIDARREEVYGALYERRGGRVFSILKEQAVSPAIFLNELSSRLGSEPRPVIFFGTGARVYKEKIVEVCMCNKLFLNDKFDEIRAAVVGQEAFELLKGKNFSRGGIDLIPHYLRASEAEIKRSRVESSI